MKRTLSLFIATATCITFADDKPAQPQVLPKADAPKQAPAKKVFRAPNGKQFPEHWGAPPLRQTRDLRVLPGGYGRGSGTLARWIQQNLEKDANKGKPGIKPVAGRKPFPKHWGAPPRLQTKDLRPLPGGYGLGSSTLAGWIQKNLDNDAKNGVPAPPVTVDPVAPPRPVAPPPVFNPEAKANELAKEQAKVDTAKVQAGIKAWEAAKAKCKGNYSYKVGFQSFVGFGHETTIVVKNNKVTERHYRTFNRRRPIAPPRPGGGAPAQPKTISWVEKGEAIGTNKRGAPAKTLDELYKVALETAQKPLKQFERRYIRSDKQGLLVSCYIRDRRIADDAPRNGLVVSSIQLGGGNEAVAAPPAPEGGGDCALCRTEAHQLHLGQAENGRTITVKLGSTLRVKLNGNPTTGFTWNNVTRGTGLKLLGKITHKAGRPVPGAPGMSTAAFQAMKLGKSELVLEYRRVFEDKPPLNTVKINIVVTEDGRATTEPTANKNQARIAELEKEIARMKDFARRARFTPEGLRKHNAKLAELENELAALKGGKNAGVPTFEEWVKGGKKIPAGKVFIGGSPWFNERTGKRRTPEEVYKMLFGKNADGPKDNAKVHKAPNGKAFPAHWGAPPLRQTRDLRPLPGGYGRGSGTLARWIQGNLDKDAKGDKPGAGGVKPGVKPVPPVVIRPGIPNRPGGRKKYPAHWGDPPRIQTRDLRPLPGGYGMGSGTLARWIQQNLDKDAAGRKPGGGANANQARVARLQARIGQIKDFMERARLTPEGLARYKAEIADLEKQIQELKAATPKPQGNSRPAVSVQFAAKHPKGSYAPGELLVGIKKGLDKAAVDKELAQALPGHKVVKSMFDHTILHLRLPDTTNVEKAMAKLKVVNCVRYAELNGIATIQPVPRPGIGIRPVPRPGIKVQPFKVEPRKLEPRKR